MQILPQNPDLTGSGFDLKGPDLTPSQKQLEGIAQNV
jgi:hypothetical protein